MFSPSAQPQLEASFKAFASRPENRPLLEEHQAGEVRAALSLQEAAQQAALQQQVAGLDAAELRALAPALRSPTLRQLLLCLSGGGGGGDAAPSGCADASADGLKAWAANPRVLQLLREAARALRQGRLSEQQLTDMLLQAAAQERRAQLHAGLPLAQPHQVVLPSHLLAEALNEHLSERQAGNRAYQQQQHQAALHHYARALAVVEFVTASSTDDQAEVCRNKAATLLNTAAVHLALQDWGAAAAACSAALVADPQHSADFAVKALLRRSSANTKLHEYQAALDDLDAAVALQPWNEDVPQLRVRVLAARRDARDTADRRLAAKMLSLG